MTRQPPILSPRERRQAADVQAHLDGDKWNLNDWNLAALCQRCHLRIQARVNFMQDWPFDHSPWMARHVEGYNAWASARHLPTLTLAGIAERSYANEWA